MYCGFFVSHGAVQLCGCWPCCATASDSSVRVLALCHGDGDVTPAHSGVHVSRLSPVWAALRWHRPMDRTDFAAMSARWDRQRRRDRQAAERHCRGDRSSFVLQHTWNVTFIEWEGNFIPFEVFLNLSTTYKKFKPKLYTHFVYNIYAKLQNFI